MTTRVSQSHFQLKLRKHEFTVSTRTLLIAIAFLAILLRLSSALYLGNKVVELPGIFDQISYDSLARRVLAGHGFTFAENHWPLTQAGEPTAHWSYLYTAYLVLVYAIFDAQPIVARILQAVLVGGLHVYVVYRIGKKAFSRNVGLISAGITAVYIYFFYYAGALMTEPFYIIAILFSLYTAMQVAENGNPREDLKWGILLGASIGVTVLFRQVFLLFIPFLFAWIWIARIRRGPGLPLVPTILSLALVVLCIVPISFYNQSRFGRFVLLNTNSGYAFYWGNHPVYGTHFSPILPAELGTYLDLVPEEIRHLDEAALDQELLKRGIQFVLDDPKRYILLSISRIPAYFMFWPSSDSGLISNISRVGSFGIMLPFMLYGVFLSLWKRRLDKANRFLAFLIAPEALLLIFAIVYSAIHLLTWALIRYRLPVDAVLVPFAALAIEDLYRRFTGIYK